MFDGSRAGFDNGAFEGFPEFNYAGLAYDTGFNRRQENIIQYWSPNWNGFVFRFAWTALESVMRPRLERIVKIDPVIRSSSLAYTNGPLWLAVTWQDHEDWTAASIGHDATDDDEYNPTFVMQSSDAESIRVAGRYIMDMGDGMSVQLSAMWEDLEYEFNGVTRLMRNGRVWVHFHDSGNFGSALATAPLQVRLVRARLANLSPPTDSFARLIRPNREATGSG